MQIEIEKYIEKCKRNGHSVNGVALAYCKADFEAGYLSCAKKSISKEKIVEFLTDIGLAQLIIKINNGEFDWHD